MISWIQTSFQHHFRVIFAVLLAVTIISFIFTIGASPGIGNAERSTVARQYFDLNLNTAEGQQRLIGDAQLSAFLNLGYSGLDGDQLQMFALQRYAALAIANELRIPSPSPTELTDFIKTLRPFVNPQTGAFDPVTYNRFRDSLKGNSRLSEGDVSRVASADYRVDRVNKLFAGPGYVLPADIAQQLSRADTTWTLATANVSYDSFKPTITPIETELTKYYEDNSFRYEVAPKFSGSYIEFPLSQFLGQIQVTEAEVKAFYDANPNRFSLPNQDPKTKLDPATAYAAVKSQVENSLKVERARRNAHKIAADITVALYEGRVTNATLDKFLSDRHLSTKALKPFTREESPAEIAGGPDVATEAFKLNASRIFSDAIAVPNGAVILLWNETIPSRKPLLAEVRAKVVSDFTEIERHKRFTQLGATIKAAIENRVKAGESFASAAEAAAKANNVSIETKTLAPFSLRQPPQDFDYTLFGIIEQLQKGQVSDMTVTGAKGLIVFAADKKVPDLSDKNPLYVTTRAQLAQRTGVATGSAILSEIVDRELKKSAPATP